MSGTHPHSVSAEVALSLVAPDGATLPVAADMHYDPGDPFAVHVAFHTGIAEDVVWTFARQLLVEGLERPAGLGDVRVWPWPERVGRSVALALSSPSGQALFEVQRDALERFLRQTFAEVAPGTESRLVDLDGELALLLLDER